MTWFSPRRTRRARRNIIRALKGNLLFLLRVLRALRGLEIVQKYCKVSAIRDGPVVRSCLTLNCGEFALDGLSLNLVATAAGRSGEPECGSLLPLDFARLAARGGAWEEPTGRPRSRWTAARSELRECERQRAAAVRGVGMKSSSRLQSTVIAVPRTSMVVFLVIWRARAGPTRGGGGRGGW